MTKQKLEIKARKFATCAHRGQFRKDGKTPYITHPAAVVELLKKSGVKNEKVLSAAWLHDVVEDCHIPTKVIEQKFGKDVADLVYILTKRGSNKDYLNKIGRSSREAQMIKLADNVHNCSTLCSKGVTLRLVRKKLRDADNFYFPLAKKISPFFYRKIKEALAPFKKNNLLVRA